MIRILEASFDPAEALATFMAGAGQGAVASFVGIVRGDGGVEALTLNHYPGFTEAEIARVVDALITSHGLSAATVVHRYGTMQPGEPIMFAATAAPHRRAALRALDELIDRLKTEAPFWKKERRDGNEHWLEASDADRADVERWVTSDD
ncbi:MAG: molybdenum cofactor biosynthesis protein MoaE [Sphingomicrobium sp.]